MATANSAPSLGQPIQLAQPAGGRSYPLFTLACISGESDAQWDLNKYHTSIQLGRNEAGGSLSVSRQAVTLTIDPVDVGVQAFRNGQSKVFVTPPEGETLELNAGQGRKIEPGSFIHLLPDSYIYELRKSAGTPAESRPASSTPSTSATAAVPDKAPHSFADHAAKNSRHPPAPQLSALAAEQHQPSGATSAQQRQETRSNAARKSASTLPSRRPTVDVDTGGSAASKLQRRDHTGGPPSEASTRSSTSTAASASPSSDVHTLKSVSLIASVGVIVCPLGNISSTQLEIWRGQLSKAGAVMISSPPPPQVYKHLLGGSGEGKNAIDDAADDTSSTASSSTEDEGRAARDAIHHWLRDDDAGGPGFGADRDVVMVVDDTITTEHLQQWWGEAPLPTAINLITTAHSSSELIAAGDAASSSSSAPQAAAVQDEQRNRLGGYAAEYHTPKWVVECIKTHKRPAADAHVWAAKRDEDDDGGGMQGAAAGGGVGDTNGNDRLSDHDGHAGKHAKEPFAHETRGMKAGDFPIPVPFTHEDNDEERAMTWALAQAESLDALYASGDAASRWGVPDISKPPLACPWTRQQLFAANAILMRACPWLEVVVPPPGQSDKGSKLGKRRSGATSATSASASTSASAAGACTTYKSAAATGGGSVIASAEGDVPAPNDESNAGRNGSGAKAHKKAIVNPFGLSKGVNLNEHITKHLKPLLEAYAVSGTVEDGWRRDSLDKAIGALVHLPYRVNTIEDARRVPNIGSRTLEKIAEILETGQLNRTAKLLSNPKIQTLMLFDSILWAGPSHAKAWYDLGYRSLDDLRLNPQDTTHQQRVGLRYYDELQTRALRDESDRVAAIVQAECEACIPGSLCVLGGSYRRGQPSSSDFDFILAPPHPFGTCDLLPRLYRRLKTKGYLTDDLTMSWGLKKEDGGGEPVDDANFGSDEVSSALFSPEHVGAQGAPRHALGAAGLDEPDRHGSAHKRRKSVSSGGEGAVAIVAPADSSAASTSAADAAPARAAVIPAHDDFSTGMSCGTYMGIWHETGRPGAAHRRIDLKCFHWKQAPYALISWTGNTPLNRSIRLFSTNLGYELDDHSLVPTLAKKDAANDKVDKQGHWQGGRLGGREKMLSGVECRSEFDVFSFLGLRFIPNTQRNCFAHFEGAGSVGAAGAEAVESS